MVTPLPAQSQWLATVGEALRFSAPRPESHFLSFEFNLGCCIHRIQHNRHRGQ